MSIATGGKVLSLPGISRNTNPSSDSRGMGFMLLYVPAWAAIAFLSHYLGTQYPNYDVIQHATYGEEFGTEVIKNHNYFFFFGGLFLPIIFTFLIINILSKFKSYFGDITAGICALITIAAMLFSLALVFIGGAPGIENKPKPFEEWANTTYGYTSIAEDTEDGMDERTFDAVKSDGSSVKVSEFKDGKYLYLYETPEQMKSIIDKITERKAAITK